ncbi:DUF6287 domain-containing protein [Streptococcus sp. HMSC056C01]|uniref:DUF6287 domain-containing protein n=1 Tax=Streptococcus sp. HMSC056C01 TaxID=1739299 RepID=UPI0008BF6303|nr:DUF6287 domain-containing protein [Streptococcus sp. HMSC056C01]OFK85119.1 ABC transporter substrate-binding protein [Streptococcus sp. HMSC056C01]
MKNKTLRYTSLSALALLAVVTLAACGGNAEKTTASSSKEASSKVTKESSSKTEASQKEEQKSETSSSSATATQTETKTENQKDYSKFLGTWENYAGTTATITADGIVTIKSSKGTFKYEMDQVEEKDGYYLTGIHLVGGGEGARLIFTPAGVQNELTGTDGSQDVLAIGQSPSDKDSHFYRN